MQAPLAHAGHWLVDLIYAAPVLILVIVGLVAHFRSRPHDD